MKKMLGFLSAAMLVMAFGGYAHAELQVKSVSSANNKPVVKKESIKTVLATIEEIDLENRMITLKGEKGKIYDMKVGPQAKNLAQLKKGDEVKLKYSEAVSARVYKAGEAPVIQEKSASLETAKEGAMPGGKISASSTITATVASIDMKKPSVDLKNSEGKILTVKIEDRRNLANVKVGDEVVITYTEALAISVEKAKKKSKKK